MKNYINEYTVDIFSAYHGIRHTYDSTSEPHQKLGLKHVKQLISAAWSCPADPYISKPLRCKVPFCLDTPHTIDFKIEHSGKQAHYGPIRLSLAPLLQNTRQACAEALIIHFFTKWRKKRKIIDLEVGVIIVFYLAWSRCFLGVFV